MQKVIVTLLFLALFVPAAAAKSGITITATKKTIEATKGNEQSLARGTSRSLEKHIAYRIKLTRKNPQLPSDVRVEWIILIEGMGGAIRTGAKGVEMLDLPFARETEFETDPVKLLGREWRGGRIPGTLEDSIAGYGIRVLGPGGEVLKEKYDPSSAESRVDWNTLQQPQSTTPVQGFGPQNLPAQDNIRRPNRVLPRRR